MNPKEHPNQYQGIGPLFDFINIKGMVESKPHTTSVDAATSIVKTCKTKLQLEVLDAFNNHGPMTDEELEELPQFTKYGPTTVSKRRTELFQQGKLIDSGIKRPNHRNHNMKVWKLI